MYHWKREFELFSLAGKQKFEEEVMGEKFFLFNRMSSFVMFNFIFYV